MGIFNAIISATRSVMTEQWKEFFICEGISPEYLMIRGKKVTGPKSQNTKSDDNVITEGSIVAVSTGESAIIVSDGKVLDVFTEPGEHIFHGGSPGIFSGSGVKNVGKDVVKRVGFGGDVIPTTQRVYYVNCKEIPNNHFSVHVPYRIKDDNVGLDMDATLKAEGTFSFKITDPAFIYKNLIGNVESAYRTQWFIDQMTSEISSMFMKVISSHSAEGTRPAITGIFAESAANKLKEEVNVYLREKRGIEIISLAFNTYGIKDVDVDILSKLQSDKVLTDPSMAAATLSDAQSEAMKSAASNSYAINKE